MSRSPFISPVSFGAGKRVLPGSLTIGPPPNGDTLTLNGAVNANALVAVADSTSGQSFGAYIKGGTNASDYALAVQTQSGGVNLFRIFGDGHGYLGWNGSTQPIAWAATGRVTIAVPASGDALTVNGLAGGSMALRAQTTADGLMTFIGRAGATNNPRLQVSTTEATVLTDLNFTGSAGSPQGTISVNGSSVVALGTNKQVTINTPTSGTALTINEVVSNPAIAMTDGTTSGQIGAYGAALQIGTSSSHPVTVYSSNTTRVTVGSAGNVTIAVPTSGATLDVSNTAGSAYALLPLRFAIGHSSGDFPIIGYNLLPTTSGGVYNYNASAVASAIQFASGGFNFLQAPSGTAGNAITFTTPLAISANGNITVGTPASGTALTINSVAGIHAVDFSDGVGTGAIVFASGKFQIGSDATHDFNIFTASTTRLAVNSTGNVTILAPSSGTALTVTAFSSSPAAMFNDGGGTVMAQFNSTSASGGLIRLSRGGSTKAFIGDAGALSVGSTDNYAFRSEASLVLASGGSNQRFVINSTGNTTVNAPDAGVALTVNANGTWAGDFTGNSGANDTIRLFNTDTTDGRTVARFRNDRTTSGEWLVGINPSGGTDKSFAFRYLTGGITPLSISAAGVVTASNSGGTALISTGDLIVSTGSIFLDNAKAVRIKDSGGTYQTALTLTAGNNVQLVNFASTGNIQILNNNAGGSVQIGTNASTVRLTVSQTGAVTIASPDSGQVALTVNSDNSSAPTLVLGGQSGSSNVLKVDSQLANGGYISVSRSATNKHFFGDAAQLVSSGTIDDTAIRATNSLVISTGGTTQRLTLSNAGNMALVAPSSGTSLTVNGVASGTQIACSDGTVTTAISRTATGGTLWTTTSHSLALGAASNVCAFVNTSGNWTFNAPTSGTTAIFGSVAGGIALQANNSGGTSAFSVGAAGDIIGRGIARCEFKASTTSRGSTTTMTDDPDLILALVAGTYQVFVFVPLDETTSGGGGFKWQFAFSGTQTQFIWSAQQNINGAHSVTGNAGLGGQSYATVSVASGQNGLDQLIINAVIKVTGSGNLSFQWAQNSSSANATNVYLGASMSAVQMS